MNNSESNTQIDTLASALRAGSRRALARAITRVESTRTVDRDWANQVVSAVIPHSGRSVRIGISGVPGVGKSTFIESFGLYLIEQGHRVAVLAIDPTSNISGGSIMGDKVRMELLARSESSFIRPSPSGGSLGGVARKTRESMLLCEAAGYDVMLIETVGVGQSEVAVSEMVDFFLVLMLPGAGDEIQGIKKGIVEMADGLVINKADGAFEKAAKQAQRYYHNALHLVRPRHKGWQTPILTASALHGQGMDAIWKMVGDHRDFLSKDGRLEALRASQMTAWFHATLREELLARLYGQEQLTLEIEQCIQKIAKKEISPHQAAEMVVHQFLAAPD